MENLKKTAIEGLLRFHIAMALLLFLPAWTIHYWQAWVFCFVIFTASLSITLFFLKKDPNLIERRASSGPGAEKLQSQKIIQGLSSVFIISIFVISGFERHYQPHKISSTISLLVYLPILSGLYIIFKVFKENTFAATIVDVEKNQTVVSTGPYSLVRHPMYSGSLFIFISTPLALGSIWALIPAICLCGMFILRLGNEEKFLTCNLKGYEEYKQKVKYRLLPYIY